MYKRQKFDDRTIASVTRIVIDAITDHPRLMSSTLLGYLLVGDIMGRMAEKGLLDSAYFGILAREHHAQELVWSIVRKLKMSGDIAETSGFYKALYVKGY